MQRPPQRISIIATLLAVALGTANADAAIVPATPSPMVDIEVWNGTATAWRARLTSEGSQEATWSGSEWSWGTVNAGAWFSPVAADGEWHMNDHWIWSRAEFSVDVSANGNLDPFISYGMVAHNTTSSTLTFQHVVTAPVLPSITGPNLVRASISGAMTDATGNGVTLVAAPDRVQDGNLGNEVQLFLLNSVNDFSATGGYTNAGVDVGLGATYTGSGTTIYGTFADGLVAGPSGTWNWMQTRTRFTLTGDNDVAVMSGFAEIVPIPEPESYAMLLAGLLVVAGIARRGGPTLG